MSENGVMTDTSAEAERDWEVPERVRAGLGAPLFVPLLVIDAVAIVLGLATTALIGLAWVGLASLAYLGWAATRGSAALRSLRAEPVADGREPRFINLVRGLAADLSLDPPKAYVIEDGRPNALVAWTGGGHAVAVTSGALSSFTRTEMEATVALALVRISSGEARRASMALALGSLGHSLVRVGTALDVRAAALTRYPPALAAALRKCEPIEGYEPLWLVARGPTHAGREDRAEALIDL